MSSAPSRVLIGGLSGGASSAGTAALLAALRAAPGERGSAARAAALPALRRGALLGSSTEALISVLGPKGVDAIVNSNRRKLSHPEHHRRYVPPEFRGEIENDISELLAMSDRLRSRSAKTVGLDSGGLGASTELGLALTKMLRERASRGKSHSNSAHTSENEDNRGKDASTSSTPLKSHVTVKSANVAIESGRDPDALEEPSAQKAKRLAELLRRAVPTSLAEGSASPTPKRGTP
jgi:hypothetical protein